MKRIVCLLLIVCILFAGSVSLSESKTVFDTAFKVYTPGRTGDISVICADFNKIKKPYPVSVRLADGTEVGSGQVRAKTTKIKITIPDGQAPRCTLYLFENGSDTAVDTFDVAVVDKSYVAVTGNYDRDDKMIALSFDCAFGETNTMYLLDTLQKYNARATFFAIGNWVSNHYDPWISRMLAEGHELGCHTMTHPRLTKKSNESIIKEINKAEDMMKDRLDGYTTHLLRPPYGSHDLRTDAVIRFLGYEVIMWGITGGDSRDNVTWKQVYNKVIDHVKPGDIVLLHNGARTLPNYLEPLLQELTRQGYTFGTVSELMNWEPADTRVVPENAD